MNRKDQDMSVDRIAFLILAHNDPIMLHELVVALDFPKFDIYVHVDAKINIDKYEFEKYELKYSKLFILNNRVKVYWGGYSIVKATLEMYRYAVVHGPYIRYVTLSGNDYPLKSNVDIYYQLNNLSIEFIAGNKEECAYKTDYFWFFDKGYWGKAISKIMQYLGIKRKKQLFVDNKVYTIYFAPQWHALSHECITYILYIIDQNPQIREFFKYTYAPDELLIPTLVFNSKFKQRCICSNFPPGTHYNEKPALHYINYSPVVEIFDEASFDVLISSGKLFARKLRSEQSKVLIEKIKEYKNQIDKDR